MVPGAYCDPRIVSPAPCSGYPTRPDEATTAATQRIRSSNTFVAPQLQTKFIDASQDGREEGVDSGSGRAITWNEPVLLKRRQPRVDGPHPATKVGDNLAAWRRGAKHPDDGSIYSEGTVTASEGGAVGREWTATTTSLACRPAEF
uniref:Uncharacterized protein n=1 Tax=Mycena chlorophos TaxID=658473 RepID=A0ABQ0M707_MYCCL|nr:predicted protein [Mycena chlorophos]